MLEKHCVTFWWPHSLCWQSKRQKCRNKSVFVVVVVVYMGHICSTECITHMISCLIANITCSRGDGNIPWRVLGKHLGKFTQFVCPLYFLGKFLFLSSLWFDKSAWLQGKNSHCTVNTCTVNTWNDIHLRRNLWTIGQA